jgi:uncharacterized protein (DUF2249 family)
MTWSCPYELEGECKRLRKACKPLSKRCVLDKKVKFIGEERKGMSEKKETLDLRPMPPFERHEKIFQAWESLKAGETLKIINDHDPKPLYYQFEAEYKDKYDWEYKQKGPKDWIVEIKKL